MRKDTTNQQGAPNEKHSRSGKRIQYLEKENQYLKHLLSDAGISYSEKEIAGISNEYDPDQGARIIPRDITETDAKVFSACSGDARMYIASEL